MIPALQSSTSILEFSFFISSTHCLTLLGSESSQVKDLLCFTPASLKASSTFSLVLPSPIMVAPRRERTRMDSFPSPELQPVISIVFPVKSIPSVTSSAVVPYPNPLDPFGLISANSDISFPRSLGS